MDLKKRVVGGLVGLVLGVQVLSMAGCAGVGKITQKETWFGGTKTPSYAQIEKKGIEEITIIKLNKNREKYKGKYVCVEGYPILSCYPKEATKDVYVCTNIFDMDGVIDANKLDMIPVYIHGKNQGVLAEFAGTKDKVKVLGKFSFGRHPLYDNEWGIEITHLGYFDKDLGTLRWLDLNFADEETVKGFVHKMKGFGKALGKEAGKAAF